MIWDPETIKELYRYLDGDEALNKYFADKDAKLDRLNLPQNDAPAKIEDGNIVAFKLDKIYYVNMLRFKNKYIAFNGKDDERFNKAKSKEIIAVYDYDTAHINDAFWDGKANIEKYGKLIWRKPVKTTPIYSKSDIPNIFTDILNMWLSRHKNSAHYLGYYEMAKELQDFTVKKFGDK